MLIFLVGYMGSGKTTVGRELAARLGYTFIDMDELFEQKHQITISEYFESFGEDSFRVKEQEILHSLLDRKDTVIATGGGTPCYFDNIEVMNRVGVTVYLKVDFDRLMERLRLDLSSRPVLNYFSGNKQYNLQNHFKRRQEYYILARITINQVFSDPIKNVQDILLKISKL